MQQDYSRLSRQPRESTRFSRRRASEFLSPGMVPMWRDRTSTIYQDRCPPRRAPLDAAFRQGSGAASSVCSYYRSPERRKSRAVFTLDVEAFSAVDDCPDQHGLMRTEV